MGAVVMKQLSTNRKWRLTIATALIASALVAVAALADQERYALTAANGVAFSDFRGYDQWEDVAVSTTGTGIKAILGNTAMIAAYKEGIPGNGKQFPDGVAIVKIEWAKAPSPVSPYPVEVPTTLRSLSFIEKDSERFPDTSGWGYAKFLYDPATRTFKPDGNDPSFGKKLCYQCHTAVADRDYIFTNYPPR